MLFEKGTLSSQLFVLFKIALYHFGRWGQQILVPQLFRTCSQPSTSKKDLNFWHQMTANHDWSKPLSRRAGEPRIVGGWNQKIFYAYCKNYDSVARFHFVLKTSPGKMSSVTKCDDWRTAFATLTLRYERALQSLKLKHEMSFPGLRFRISSTLFGSKSYSSWRKHPVKWNSPAVAEFLRIQEYSAENKFR